MGNQCNRASGRVSDGSLGDFEDYGYLYDNDDYDGDDIDYDGDFWRRMMD